LIEEVHEVVDPLPIIIEEPAGDVADQEEEEGDDLPPLEFMGMPAEGSPEISKVIQLLEIQAQGKSIEELKTLFPAEVWAATTALAKEIIAAEEDSISPDDSVSAVGAARPPSSAPAPAPATSSSAVSQVAESEPASSWIQLGQPMQTEEER
jgi:hypothetical protein